MGPDNQMLEYKEMVKKVSSQIKGIKTKGIDTLPIEKKVETSTVFMMRDDFKKALELINEANNDIMAIRTQLETPSKGQSGGKNKLGKGLSALLTDGGLKLADETDPNAAKERNKAARSPIDITPGSSFIIPEKRPQRCFEMFSYLLANGLTGLAFTTEEPKGVANEYKIAPKESLIWVTDEVSADFNTLPKNIQKINEYYLERLHTTKPSVVLMQGLDALIKDASMPRDVTDSLQNFNKAMKDLGGILIVDVQPSTFKDHEPKFRESFSVLDLPNSVSMDEALRMGLGNFKVKSPPPTTQQTSIEARSQPTPAVKSSPPPEPKPAPSAPATASSPDPKRAAHQQAMRAARIEEITLFIQDWRSDGFDISTFERDLDKELPIIEESFIQFSEKISRLKDMLDQLDDFKRKHKAELPLIKSQIDALDAPLHNPEAVDEAEKGLAGLDSALESEKKKRQEDGANKRRKEVQAILDDWKKHGFVLKDLEEAMTKPPEVLEQTFMRTAEQVQDTEGMLEALDLLEAQSAAGMRLLKDHFESIKSGMRDIRDAKAKRASIDALRAFLDSNSGPLESIDERIARQQQKGRDVSAYLDQFKQALATIDPQSILRSLDNFETQMNHKEEIMNYVRDLPRLTAKFKDDPDMVRITSELSQLERTMPATESISPIYSKFLSLRGAINEHMKKRDIQMKAEQELRAQRLSKYKAELKQWESEGYIATAFRTAIDRGDVLDELERVYSQTKQKIDEIKVQSGQLFKMLTPENLADFKEDIADIKKDLLDTERSQDATQKILKLQYKVKQKDKERSERKIDDERRSYIRKTLEGYKRDGYQVASFEAKLSGPIPVSEQAFEDLKARIQKVESIKADLSRLDMRGLDALSAPLLAILSDPYQIEKMEQLSKKLKDTVSSNSQRRDEIRKAVKAWKDSGLDTLSIDSAMGNDLVTLEKRFSDLSLRVEKLKALKKELESLSTSGFERKVKVIQNKMSSPENLESIIEDMAFLKAEIEKGRSQQSAIDQQKRDEFLRMAMEWQSMGYNVDEILDTLQAPTSGMGLEDASTLLNIYKAKIDKAEHIRSDLQAIDNPDLQDDIALLTENITNLDILEELEDSYGELMKRALEMESSFSKYDLIIEKFRSEGYVVTRLEALRGKPQEDITQGFIMFENDIKLLGDLRDAMVGLQSAPHPPEYDGVFADLFIKLADPDRIAEIGQNITELEEHLRAYNEAPTPAPVVKDTRPITPSKPAPVQSPVAKAPATSPEVLSKQITEVAQGMPDAQMAGRTPADTGPNEDRPGAEPKKKLKIAKRPVPVNSQATAPTGPGPSPAAPRPVPVQKAPEVPRPQPAPVSAGKPEVAKPKPRPVPVHKGADGPKPKPVPVAKGQAPAPSGDKQARVKQLKEDAKAASKNKDFTKAVQIYDQIQALDPADKEAEFLKKRALTFLKSSGGDKQAASAAAQPSTPAKDAGKASAAAATGATQTTAPSATSSASPVQPNPAVSDKQKNCTSCGGTGKCYWCNGTGKCDSCGGSGKNIVGSQCVSCKGNGKCQNCDGTGLCYWCQK